jgi:hypothetical protein
VLLQGSHSIAPACLPQEAQQQLDAAEARLLAVIEDIIEEGDFDSLVDDFDLGEQQEREAAAARSAACAGAGTEPPSFSKVELALPAAQLKQRFPRFPGLGAAKEVVVEAGQMLYLPAGGGRRCRCTRDLQVPCTGRPVMPASLELGSGGWRMCRDNAGCAAAW